MKEWLLLIGLSFAVNFTTGCVKFYFKNRERIRFERKWKGHWTDYYKQFRLDYDEWTYYE